MTTGCRRRSSLGRLDATAAATAACRGVHHRGFGGGQGGRRRRLGGDLLRGRLRRGGGRLLDEGAELGEDAAAVLVGELGLRLEVRLLGRQLRVSRCERDQNERAKNSQRTGPQQQYRQRRRREEGRAALEMQKGGGGGEGKRKKKKQEHQEGVARSVF